MRRSKRIAQASCALVSLLALATSDLGSAMASRPSARSKPDLVVKWLSVPPVADTRGGALTIRDTVRNVGSRRARPSVIRYYLSLDRIRSRRDVRLSGRRAVKALRPGRASRGAVKVVLGAQPRAGEYFILACADAGRLVRERRETNNCRAARLKLSSSSSQLPPPPPGPPPGPPAPPAPPPPRLTVLWQADMEEGSLADWYSPATGPSGYYGGGEFNSGTGDTVATGERAHTGSQAANLTITTPPESATRLFRWHEPQQNREAYYSAWFYVPQSYQVLNWWDIFQFKSVNAENTTTDPFWYIVLQDTPFGGLRPEMHWWDLHVEGPHKGEFGFRIYQPLTAVTIPLQRWFKLECFLRQSNAFDGRLTCWLDSTKIFDFTDVKTGYERCTYNAWCVDNHWSVNNYSDRLLPGVATILVDDASIAKP